MRFGDLVRGSGRPEVVTLWTDPKKDRSFSKAIDENRVLTVQTDPGSHRKEYGQIGFHQQDGAIYLVFPKALPEGIDARIVGINYQLAEDRPPKDPVTSEFREELARKAQTQKESAQKKERPERIAEKVAAPAKPELKTFEVTVRRIATLEEKRRVKAETEQAAKESALEVVRAKRFDIGRAQVRAEVAAVARLDPP